jgi:hypothetical protein
MRSNSSLPPPPLLRYKVVFSAFRSVFEGLGITCDEVGGLVDEMDGPHACHGGEEEPAVELMQEQRLVQLEQQLQAVIGDQPSNGGGNGGVWALVAVNVATILLLVGRVAYARCSKKVSHTRLQTEEPELSSQVTV